MGWDGWGVRCADCVRDGDTRNGTSIATTVRYGGPDWLNDTDRMRARADGVCKFGWRASNPLIIARPPQPRARWGGDNSSTAWTAVVVAVVRNTSGDGDAPGAVPPPRGGDLQRIQGGWGLQGGRKKTSDQQRLKFEKRAATYVEGRVDAAGVCCDGRRRSLCMSNGGARRRGAAVVVLDKRRGGRTCARAWQKRSQHRRPGPVCGELGPVARAGAVAPRQGGRLGRSAGLDRTWSRRSGGRGTRSGPRGEGQVLAASARADGARRQGTAAAAVAAACPDLCDGPGKQWALRRTLRHALLRCL